MPPWSRAAEAWPGLVNGTYARLEERRKVGESTGDGTRLVAGDACAPRCDILFGAAKAIDMAVITSAIGDE